MAAKNDSAQFEISVTPTVPIDREASAVTGLTVSNGFLCYHAPPVTSFTLIDAATSFLQFLRRINHRIILVAHNCFSFDRRIIMTFLNNAGLSDEFFDIVIGFVDTRPLIKTALKGKRDDKVSYKQSDLANEFSGPKSSKRAHNAIHDVDILQQLVQHVDINITREIIIKHMRTIQGEELKKKEKSKLDSLCCGLQCLKRPAGEGKRDKKDQDTIGLSTCMITKLAKAGITMDNLRQCHSLQGEPSIRILLAQDICGKPRVTNKQIITDLCKKSVELQNEI